MGMLSRSGNNGREQIVVSNWWLFTFPAVHWLWCGFFMDYGLARVRRVWRGRCAVGVFEMQGYASLRRGPENAARSQSIGSCGNLEPQNRKSRAKEQCLLSIIERLKTDIVRLSMEIPYKKKCLVCPLSVRAQACLNCLLPWFLGAWPSSPPKNVMSFFFERINTECRNHLNPRGEKKRIDIKGFFL